MTGWNENINYFKGKVANLELSPPTAIILSTPIFSPFDTGGIRSDQLLRLIEDLQERVKGLESKKGTLAVRFMHLCWKTLKDGRDFVDANRKAVEFGLFIDFVLLALLVDIQLHGDLDYIEKYRSLDKSKLSGISNHTAITSYALGTPPLYNKTGNSSYLSLKVLAFDPYSKAKDWKDCIKEDLIKTANSMYINFQQHFDHLLTGVVQELCTLPLQRLILCFLMFNS